MNIFVIVKLRGMLKIEIKRCAEQSFEVRFMCILRQIAENIAAVIVKDDNRKVDIFKFCKQQTVNIMIHRYVSNQHGNRLFGAEAEGTGNHTVNTVGAAVREYIMDNTCIVTLKVSDRHTAG